MNSEQEYIVETDAIYGGGVQLKRGDITTAEQLGQYLEPLLAAGAIRLLTYSGNANLSEHVSLR